MLQVLANLMWYGTQAGLTTSRARLTDVTLSLTSLWPPPQPSPTAETVRLGLLQGSPKWPGDGEATSLDKKKGYAFQSAFAHALPAKGDRAESATNDDKGGWTDTRVSSADRKKGGA